MALHEVDEFAEWQACSKRPMSLKLKSGSSWQGWNFGASKSVAGEVVFSTGMVGYVESLTDPSFVGQILVITFPLVGNYGVPDDEMDECGLPRHFEGRKIFPAAVVVAEYSFSASHYLAKRTLGKWLEEQGVPGIFGVDTREITKSLRTMGSTLGMVLLDSDSTAPPAWVDPNQRNLVAEVSIEQPRLFKPTKVAENSQAKPIKVIAVDCGMKYNIIRFFVDHLQVELKVVPWDYDFTTEDMNGLFISNGPGDPQLCAATISNLRKVLASRPTLPVFGICLGHQLLSLAAGAKTYKMKFGNRGMNQPCIDLRTGRCYITAQNHGFAVDDTTLPNGWKPLFTNANDGSNEGIAHQQSPWLSVQFHPEACGGPLDTTFLFDEFLRVLTSTNGGRQLTTIHYLHPKPPMKVLILGSGGLTIGQAGEFDYSGSQAIKALHEEHVQSILINPNIATVQTSKGLADHVFFVPVTPEFVEKVIEKVRPDGLFAAFGGQTALNCAVQLHDSGVLEKYGVRVLGTPIKAIVSTEDRDIFKQKVEEVGEMVAKSGCANSFEEAKKIAQEIGYPVLVRAAYALGGLGSGFATQESELEKLCERAFSNSPQVIIDECLKGWKELEYEVMRDSHDNCLVVCNMENIDPMGIHTGESIVVAPSQTLNNNEFQKLRDTAIKVIRHLGIVGEANIQYALDPYSNQYRIVEVNARLSRSSALASKATGYPLAYIAAKIALGHDLVSLRNLVTRSTTACFEPSLDYCVIKIPRWDISKFHNVDPRLGTQMKSVGEVMSIARTFPEALQKALRMVDERSMGFEGMRYEAFESTGTSRGLEAELEHPGPMRMWAFAHAFEKGWTITQLNELTKVDPWYLSKMQTIHKCWKQLQATGSAAGFKKEVALLRRSKELGFSDKQIAVAVNATESEIRQCRRVFDIFPCVKQVDTLAAEFPAQTNYLYLTYLGSGHDVLPLRQDELPAYKDSLYDSAFGKGALEEEDAWDPVGDRATPGSPRGEQEKVKNSYAVLGSGCYRIGASVEFDWCSVNAVRTLRETGQRALVINCNPETVSTDFDESNRLYFEELSQEVVLSICELEKPSGVVVSVGGQTPNNLAMGLHKSGVKILGTSVQAIDSCENRFKFSKLCDALRIDQPEWSEFTSTDEAFHFSKRVGYPVLVRPSYVLSGAAMRVVTDDAELARFLRTAAVVSREYPVVISKYVAGGKEVELDAVGCNGTLVNYAIAEHVENAGVHSGDATLLLPAQKLFVETHRRVKQIGQKICQALKISGPFNIQFICKENEVKVIECNLRASRSMPFISKTYNVNFIELATRVMVGQQVPPAAIMPIDMEFVAVKVPVFSFDRLLNSDPRLGVEMQSTGEVACFGVNQYEAFLKAMMARGFKLPAKNVLICIGPEPQKLEFLPYAKMLESMGFQLYCTKNTHEVFKRQGVETAVLVYKPLVKREPNTSTLLSNGKLDLVINVPDSMDSQALTDGFTLRRSAVDTSTPLIVDIKTAILTVMSLHRKWSRESTGRTFFSYASWQEYVQPPEVAAV
mmetsp:Transcript_14182/g.32133  ORF Transcript_14182/g.32133 Transcript_14182/m.32133 type:complete len:1533 (+) Transcript_14182:66-4664(+)